MNENILWDKKISTYEAKNILKDENNQKFIYLASTILSRTNDVKNVFSDYLDKILFCRNWNRIKNRMRKNRWNDRNIAFWDEIYKVIRKTIKPSLLKISKHGTEPIKPKVKKIGASLRDARKRAKLTQKELSAQTNLSQQTISALEKGRVNFSFETLIKILDTLNLQIALIPLERKGEYIDTEKHQWQVFSG